MHILPNYHSVQTGVFHLIYERFGYVTPHTCVHHLLPGKILEGFIISFNGAQAAISLRKESIHIQFSCKLDDQLQGNASEIGWGIRHEIWQFVISNQ